MAFIVTIGLTEETRATHRAMHATLLRQPKAFRNVTETAVDAWNGVSPRENPRTPVSCQESRGSRLIAPSPATVPK
jgi:hypothetical protein